MGPRDFPAVLELILNAEPLMEDRCQAPLLRLTSPTSRVSTSYLGAFAPHPTSCHGKKHKAVRCDQGCHSFAYTIYY
jgi:hypothetical protein